jgi:hypothetical protein
LCSWVIIFQRITIKNDAITQIFAPKTQNNNKLYQNIQLAEFFDGFGDDALGILFFCDISDDDENLVRITTSRFHRQLTSFLKINLIRCREEYVDLLLISFIYLVVLCNTGWSATRARHRHGGGRGISSPWVKKTCSSRSGEKNWTSNG